MASQFSEDGRYFAQLSTDGKLKIWNALSNTFEQEFTPDYHLTTPCTCLHFVKSKSDPTKGSPSPKKKKRRESQMIEDSKIALGTTNGTLLVYSINKADVDFTINSETNQSITCLSGVDGNIVYSGSDQSVLEFNVTKRNLRSKWKAGNEKITAILAVADGEHLVTASKTIKVWNIRKKEVVKNFTGHSSDVVLLQSIETSVNNDFYIVSGSKGDRLLSCWNLSETSSEKNAITNFLMEDIVQNVSIKINDEGETMVCTTVRSGVVHIYQQKLNGKSGKPVKPKTTIQVVSDTGQNDMVMPIRIFGAVFSGADTLCIAHGTEIILTFENIEFVSYKKVQCLIRKDPHSTSKNSTAPSKIVTPLINDDVSYLTPQTSAVSTSKRKAGGQIEVPLEQRISNLTLEKGESSGVPKPKNMAQLLLQGLKSNDKTILRTVLSKNEVEVVKNTVERLPVQVLKPLMEELSEMLNGKNLTASETATIWLKYILQTHIGILMANPDLQESLNSVQTIIKQKQKMQLKRSQLIGKIDFLLSLHKNVSKSNENSTDEKPLLVYNDRDSSDSESVEDMQLDGQSESENEENEWEESSSDGEVNNENHEENDSDDLSEMSS